jgi:hypothetical protein
VAHFLASRYGCGNSDTKGSQTCSPSPSAKLSLNSTVSTTFQDTSEGVSEVLRRTATVLPLEGAYYVGAVQPAVHVSRGGGSGGSSGGKGGQ